MIINAKTIFGQSDHFGQADLFGRSTDSSISKNAQNGILIENLFQGRSVKAHGTRREADEDSNIEIQGTILAIANGIESRKGHHSAAELIIQTLKDYVSASANRFIDLLHRSDKELREELVVLVERCHRRLKRENWNPEHTSTMSAVLTVACIFGSFMYVAHVGDNRCYLFRNQQLRQVTKDHTVGQQLVDSEAMSEQAIEKSPWKNVIWNCLGGQSGHVSPVINQVRLETGDIVLMCSNELTKYLPSEVISSILRERKSSQELVESLVRAASDRGCREAASLIVANFEGASRPRTDKVS